MLFHLHIDVLNCNKHSVVFQEIMDVFTCTKYRCLCKTGFIQGDVVVSLFLFLAVTTSPGGLCLWRNLSGL